MINKVEKKILKKMKKIVNYIEIKKMLKIYKNEEKIIYFQTPEHGNLGDQAIAIAGNKILKDKYPNKLILEFTFDQYYQNKEQIKKLINNKDIIYIHGGGNFGNLYVEEENQRRDIITTFLNNKIISMPQSLSYSSDENGQKELELTKKIIANHKQLTIIARDEKSYAFAKDKFINTDIILVPDIVLYLEDFYIKKTFNKREGVIFTLRKDKEKILSNEKIEQIKRLLEKENIDYIIDDTTVDYDVNKVNREFEVEKILRKISSSKLNITDRFHGVIFSVITNTPVIVFKSLDHKIFEGIKWFKHLDYVHYLTEDDDIEELIKKYTTKNIVIKKDSYLIKELIEEKIFKL